MDANYKNSIFLNSLFRYFEELNNHTELSDLHYRCNTAPEFISKQVSGRLVDWRPNKNNGTLNRTRLLQ